MAGPLKYCDCISLGWVLPAVRVQRNQTKAVSSGASIVAFPGAEGGGAYTSGGRGGHVYIVTNLKDYSENGEPIEGSLRQGIVSTPERVVRLFLTYPERLN